MILLVNDSGDDRFNRYDGRGLVCCLSLADHAGTILTILTVLTDLSEAKRQVVERCRAKNESVYRLRACSSVIKMLGETLREVAGGRFPTAWPHARHIGSAESCQICHGKIGYFQAHGSI